MGVFAAAYNRVTREFACGIIAALLLSETLRDLSIYVMQNHQESDPKLLAQSLGVPWAGLPIAVIFALSSAAIWWVGARIHLNLARRRGIP